MVHDKIGKTTTNLIAWILCFPINIQLGCIIEQLDVSENQISTLPSFFSLHRTSLSLRQFSAVIQRAMMK